MRNIHRRSLDTPHKGPIMGKVFPRKDVFIKLATFSWSSVKFPLKRSGVGPGIPSFFNWDKRCLRSLKVYKSTQMTYNERARWMHKVGVFKRVSKHQPVKRFWLLPTSSEVNDTAPFMKAVLWLAVGLCNKTIPITGTCMACETKYL